MNHYFKYSFPQTSHNQYPYGKVLREFNEATDARYLTTHHERDKETGFDYRGARFYDSDLGRFLSLDPMAMEYPSYSDYSYVLGNPIKYTDPTGMVVEDEWQLNVTTGDITKISDEGGDELQIVNFVADDENGGLLDLGTDIVEGSTLYTGPVAFGIDRKLSFTVSSVDLWSDIPTKYLGHYNRIDLVQRYDYQHNSPKQYEKVKEQESKGMHRADMIWNSSDEYKQVASKYQGNPSAFAMALENKMLPMPVGALGVYSRSVTMARGITSGTQTVFVKSVNAAVLKEMNTKRPKKK